MLVVWYSPPGPGLHRPFFQGGNETNFAELSSRIDPATVCAKTTRPGSPEHLVDVVTDRAYGSLNIVRRITYFHERENKTAIRVHWDCLLLEVAPP